MKRLNFILRNLRSLRISKTGKISEREKARLDFEAMPVEARVSHIVFKKEKQS